MDTVKKKMRRVFMQKKRVKNDKIEIPGFIFMLTTWEYTSGYKITSPTP